MESKNKHHEINKKHQRTVGKMKQKLKLRDQSQGYEIVTLSKNA